MSNFSREIEQIIRPEMSLNAAGSNLFRAEDALNDQEAAGADQAFTEKWRMIEYDSDDYRRLLTNQKEWYLRKYGFADENDLKTSLSSCRFILDAGSGNAMKAAWFAELSPETVVVAADVSESIEVAAEYFSGRPNMFFLRCDIARMPFFHDGAFDYVNCDEVIHHTQTPEETFAELVRVTKPGQQLICYVYRKKALPRELLDDHFRTYASELSTEELKELSSSLTELGRLLDSIEGEYDFPAIPSLGISGGPATVQRFIYWNFIKCFWNPDLGRASSELINFDWYSPLQANRYTKEEFLSWIDRHKLLIAHFHEEEACYCGRFLRPM